MRLTLEKDHVAIGTLYNQIAGLAYTVRHEMNAVAHLSNAMSQYINLHDKIMELNTAVHTLLSGDLSPHLVGI